MEFSILIVGNVLLQASLPILLQRLAGPYIVRRDRSMQDSCQTKRESFAGFIGASLRARERSRVRGWPLLGRRNSLPDSGECSPLGNSWLRGTTSRRFPRTGGSETRARQGDAPRNIPCRDLPDRDETRWVCRAKPASRETSAPLRCIQNRHPSQHRN